MTKALALRAVAGQASRSKALDGRWYRLTKATK